MTVLTWIALAAALAYTAAGLGLARRVLARGSAHGSAPWLALGAAGVVAQLAVHMGATATQGLPDLHFLSALSLVALGMAALTLAGAWLERLEALGVLVFPIAAASLLAYALAGQPGQTGTALPWPIKLHAWLALLAYAALALAALFAIGLWVQERALRRRRITRLIRALPPLTQTESLLFRTLVAGFALLTLALAIGLVFVQDLLAQHLAHKTVLSLLSWTILAVLLLGRWRWGWRGPRAVRWTLTAMLLLGLAFFGSGFVYEFLLAG